MARKETTRLAILGAGPIGLEAALYASNLGLQVAAYERGRIGEYVRRWGHVRLFSPFGMNTTSLGRDAIRQAHPNHDFPADADCLTGREHVAGYLDPLSQTPALKPCLHLETQVVAVSRHGFLKDDEVADPARAKAPFRLLVRDNNKKERVEEADVVLDCTGTYGQHRWAGDGGIPALGELAAEPHIHYGLEDILGDKKAAFSGKNVLVIGAGYSAATSVNSLSKLADQNPETWIIWLARSSRTQPLRRIANDPLKERDRLAVKANTLATRGECNVEYHAQSQVESIEFLGPDRGFRVNGSVAGERRTWDVERLIANVGYTPDTSLYRELQIHECYASLGPMNLAAALAKQAGADCLTFTGSGPDSLRNPEPNFFLLGAKSYGRNAHFLLRQGFEQIRDVFRLILGKPDLDLYKRS